MNKAILKAGRMDVQRSSERIKCVKKLDEKEGVQAVSQGKYAQNRLDGKYMPTSLRYGGKS